MLVDANYIEDYIVKDELDLSDNDKTIFRIKFLTIRQKKLILSNDGIINSVNVGKILVENIIDWENFKDENGDNIKFNISKIDLIPSVYLKEIFNYILSKSTIDKETENIIRGLTRFILSNDKSDTWLCKNCLRLRLNVKRNCERFGIDEIDIFDEDDDEKSIELADEKKIDKYKLKKGKNLKIVSDNKNIVFRSGNKIFDFCPLSRATQEIEFYVGLIFWSKNDKLLLNEGGILDQANYYYELRNIISDEEAKYEEEIEKENKRKKNNRFMGNRR